MKIRTMSDLHTEFGSFTIDNTTDADVLLLNGDVLLLDDLLSDYGRATQCLEFFEQVCSAFPHVIWIYGNHEFYHGKFFEYRDKAKEKCKRFANLHILDNDFVKIDDVVFIGTSMWTDCNNRDQDTLARLHRMMNDFRIIINDKTQKPFTPYDMVDYHDLCKLFLINTLHSQKALGETKFVVSTHHAPSDKSIHEMYKNDTIMNGGYYANLEHIMIDNPEIQLWCHGHMHKLFDYTVGQTRVVCNPRGYNNGFDRQEDTCWNPELTIEV